MHPLRIIAICCVIILAISGCGSSVGASLADNEEIKAAQDNVPFTIILPEHIPDGYTFAEIRVSTPPPQVTEGMYLVSLIFTSGDNGYMEVEQSNYEIEMDTGDDVEGIALSEMVTAEFFVTELASGETARYLTNFTVDEVGVSIMATDLSKSDIIKVGESLLAD